MRRLLGALFSRDPQKGKLPLLWNILYVGLRVAVVIFVGFVILRGAALAGAYVDQACVSRPAFDAIKSLATQVTPFLPHSPEGSGLLIGGDVFKPIETGKWPGLERATVNWSSKYWPGHTWTVHTRMANVAVGFPSYFEPPLGYHTLAALGAFAICGTLAWFARRDHGSLSFQSRCLVGLALVVITLPAAFMAWSGPQVVSVFWEQVFDASGHGFVAAKDRVWVQPALGDVGGVLCFGIIYAACLFAAAWQAAIFFMNIGDRTRANRCVMGGDGVARCWRCGYPLGHQSMCSECGLAHGDLPPRGWPWNSRLIRTRRARRVALCSLVGAAAIASAALPLIVGVTQVLFKRL